LATQVRRDLDGHDEIASDALRQMVAEQLAEHFDDSYRRRYLQPQEAAPSVLVRDRSGGNRSPFLAARLTRSLETAALSPDQAAAVTARVQQRLLRELHKEIASQALGRMVYEDLQRFHGAEIAQRYLVWLDFWHSGRPLILLVGGINGVGKSTVAAELAHRLEIVRTQSTDMLREVMRKMTSKRLMPAVHTSSFRAWQALPTGYTAPAGDETLVIDGFLTQAEQVSVAMDAVLRRALSEHVSMILEGIHLHPAYMHSFAREKEPIVVAFVLAVLDPEQLRSQLRGRATDAPNRRAERYLKNFDVIWQLQSFLLDEADRYHVPIISDWATVKASEQAMDMIYAVLARRYGQDEAEILGKL
jgi:2-phosphoglycerate kinase